MTSSIGSRALDRILSRVRALAEARRTGGKAKAAAASAVALFYLAVVFRQGRRPVLYCQRNGHNVRILRALSGLVDRPYYPSWLTPNAHVNCLLGYAKRGITLSKTRELVRCWGECVFFSFFLFCFCFCFLFLPWTLAARRVQKKSTEKPGSEGCPSAH